MFSPPPYLWQRHILRVRTNGRFADSRCRELAPARDKDHYRPLDVVRAAAGAGSSSERHVRVIGIDGMVTVKIAEMVGAGSVLIRVHVGLDDIPPLAVGGRIRSQ